MNTLPILLKDPKILLIGGGKVALQKAEVLYSNKIDFSIISQEYLPAFDEIKVPREQQSFDINQTKKYNIIIDATGNTKVTQELISEKQKRFLMLNVVDDVQYCDFFFSSLLNYGKLKIAISSDGASPTLTQVVRNKIKSAIPHEVKILVDNLYKNRLKGIIDVISTKTKANKLLNPIYLIGCGLGDVEYLTLKAYRLIQDMDIVLYDSLISEEILDIIPSSTRKIYVGKRKGHHYKSQDEINQLLLELSLQNKKIARLKSGDPFIFGRGYEELESLSKAGFKVEVVSGISSAVSALSCVGIPLTSRGISNSFSVVSAQLQNNELNTNWLDLLSRPMHTTVVLMGLSACSHIQTQALKYGVNPNTKVMIISNASRPSQKSKSTTLDNLAKLSCEFQSPAVLIFGDVVSL